MRRSLKSAAYIRASVGGADRSCDILRASLPVNLPWIRSLIDRRRGWTGALLDAHSTLVGAQSRATVNYFKKAQQTRDFVFSDFLLAKSDDTPIMIAAYPVSAIDDDADSVIVAGVDLDWVSKFIGNLGGRPGISAVMVDSQGVVLAAPEDQAEMVGRALYTLPILSHRRTSGRFGPSRRIVFIRRARRLAADRRTFPAFPARNRA